MKPGLLPLCVTVLICSLRLDAAGVDASKLPPPATAPVDFSRDIKPILETSCLRCHGPENQKSHFRLDNRPSALKGGEQGTDILAGDSAKSPLIHYVAGVVADSEMPPLGKGDPLTPAQVSLLRAWIDQGAAWDVAGPTNHLEFLITPTLGGTVVSGNRQKFREHYWQKDGVNGGVQEFELVQQSGPDIRWLLNGHALLDDYKIGVSVDRKDFGFIHSGWEQYRKYFGDAGGYAPLLLPAAPRLGQDLHLDIGRAWIDFGLTFPDWPRLVLGYEYDYKQGDEATTSWNAVGPQAAGRNIGPAAKHLDEGTHIIKFDLDAEVQGVSIEERFRGEFYKLKTGTTNVAFGPLPQSTAERTTYFQGANTIRLEKKFNDWFYGSGGYLYSKLDADSAFRMDAPGLQQIVNIPEIELERESHVANLNGLFGPFQGLTFSTGAQAEWTRQHDLGAGIYDQQTPPPPPIVDTLLPFTVASDYDTTSVQENAALRYSGIPFTTLFAEGRLDQESTRQYDQFAAAHNILNKAVFLQRTDFSSLSSDIRLGFSTSPWRRAAFSAHYRRYDDASRYDNAPLIQPAKTGYPGFLRSRDLLTDEVGAKLVLHATSRFSTTLTYQYQATENDLSTGPFTQFGSVISPGGGLIAGRDYSHVFSINATYTPMARLFLAGTFSYTASSLATMAYNSLAVVPYHGEIYTGLADATCVLSETTDLFAAYTISEAEYGQNNYAGGQPLGIQYQQQSASVGLSRRLGKNISAKLQYRFALYNEPGSGGANNYQAHSIFGTLMFQFR